MRIIVTGATGNIGTSVLRKLRADPAIRQLVGVARRRPPTAPQKTTWLAADVARADLAPVFEGAAAVVHLAWAWHPPREEETRWATNVTGTTRVLDAVRRAGVPTVVVVSAAAAYAPEGDDRPVAESAPVTGVPSSSFSRHKAAVEVVLDAFEAHHPAVRVVRLRPAVVLKREAAGAVRQTFLGPLLPARALRSGRLPVVPDVRGARLQAVHSFDVADAVRLALLRPDARGAYNLAAPPVLDARSVQLAFGGRALRIPRAAARAALDAGFRLGVHPTEPGWLDLATAAPLVDVTRARTQLGWEPAFGATAALQELLDGLAAGDPPALLPPDAPALPAGPSADAPRSPVPARH
ncbi:NAD-dependent epimerase/dehydratase family protein [Svornostia abyssi]|uniref:NAD-dependent epimerase/dehydratase family protein n=1 Tax=Svornostia abyssi TaxID=2898438 RepID=A0ABY5PFN2_9ACTN|nr:NAD-dependent epimerase/dehydratase family protein [Parviterribacteraceae bacterium J379]